MPTDGDFYEDDEPIEKIRAAWEDAPKQMTVPSLASRRPGASAPGDVVVQLDAELIAALDARADADHTNPSDIISRALRAWLDVA